MASGTDYHAYGFAMAGRTWEGGGVYRYGMNTQEKSPEIGDGHYTAQFWEYDSGLSRRWELDPRPNVSISGYAVFGGNPIVNVDVLGDTTDYYDIKNGDYLGRIEDKRGMQYVRVDKKCFQKALFEAKLKSQNLKKTEEGQRFNSKLMQDCTIQEMKTGNNNLISYAKHVDMDFTGQLVAGSEMGAGSENAEYGVRGTLNLNVVFDDGKKITINSYNATSGPWGNGPIPNGTYTTEDNGTRFSPTYESGMLIYGSQGWKVHLNPVLSRTGLRLHPDTNGEGTAGCIGVREPQEKLNALGAFLKGYLLKKTFVVNVNIVNNPNYPGGGATVATGQ